MSKVEFWILRSFLLIKQCLGPSSRCDHALWFQRLELQRSGDSPYSEWMFSWGGTRTTDCRINTKESYHWAILTSLYLTKHCDTPQALVHFRTELRFCVGRPAFNKWTFKAIFMSFFLALNALNRTFLRPDCCIIVVCGCFFFSIQLFPFMTRVRCFWTISSILVKISVLTLNRPWVFYPPFHCKQCQTYSGADWNF